MTWYFGDGDTAIGAAASHTYTRAGTYRVTVVYLSFAIDSGGMATTSAPVTVHVGDAKSLGGAFVSGLVTGLTNVEINPPVQTNTPPLARAVLNVSPRQISLHSTVGVTYLPPQEITLKNEGKAPLDWRSSADAKWVELSTSQGKISSGQSYVVRVFLHPSGMLDGTFHSRLSFASPSVRPIPVEVALTLDPAVPAPPPPPSTNWMTELLSNPVVWGLGTCVAGGLVFRVLKRRGVKVEPVASTWSSQRIVSTGSLLSEFVHIRVTDKQPVVTRVLVNGHMIAAGPATLEARR